MLGYGLSTSNACDRKPLGLELVAAHVPVECTRQGPRCTELHVPDGQTVGSGLEVLERAAMEAVLKATLLWCAVCLVFASHHVEARNATLSANQASSVILSAVNYSDVRVGPYDWKYFRVELPVGFSSVSMVWRKKWDMGNQASASDKLAPLVCFRFGGPPLPAPALESVMMAAIAAGRIQNTTDMGKCAMFYDSTSFSLTNQQVIYGVIYIGVFSDPNPTRTQSQMISRGNVYSFQLHLQVYGCHSTRGELCSVDKNLFYLPLPSPLLIPGGLFDHGFKVSKEDNVSYLDSNLDPNSSYSSNYYENSQGGRDDLLSVTPTDQGSWSSMTGQCIEHAAWKFHALRVIDIAKTLEFKLDDKSDACEGGYVRYGALPDNTTTSYNLDVSSPLSIGAPKVGMWYLGMKMKAQNASGQCCYSISWRLDTCGLGGIGEGCAWNVTALERVLAERVESPFDSYYVPIGATRSSSNRFPLNLLPGTTGKDADLTNEAWTYLYLSVPQGAAGSVLSLDVIGSASTQLQLVVRYEGLPTSTIWDYRAEQIQALTGRDANVSNSPALNHEKLTSLKLDIIYPAEGTWYIAARSLVGVGTKNSSTMYNMVANPQTNTYSQSENAGQTTNLTSNSIATNQGVGSSISDATLRLGLHGCVDKCSGHGFCQTEFDESRLNVYSYCYCDRTHGDLDCSVKIVGGGDQALHIIALVASNVAAALPSVWCLRQKVYSEWIVFTTSGLSSAIYHSCDAGGWCALSYSTLQFLDFWLSFLSVVVTCLHMAAFLGSSKAAMHIGGAIFTAMIAKENATSAANVIIVVCIGAAGLLMGFALESWSLQPATSLRTRWRICRASILPTFRWDMVILYVRTSTQILGQRFRWPYVLIGVAALLAAKLNVVFETAQTYWIWHSLWHVSIYTSAFCFLQSRILREVKETQLDETNPLLLDETEGYGVRRKRIPAEGEAAELASYAEDVTEVLS